MPVTYECCDQMDKTVSAMAAKVMEKYHGDLWRAAVDVALIFARASRNKKGEIAAAAVNLNGYPCFAVCKIIGLKERADGRADAEIVIDEDEWKKMSDPEKEALLDHELNHLVLRKHNKKGHVLKDGLDRPMLKMRKHDHQFGWFDNIAQRHGDGSFEVRQAKQFADENGQVYFGWAKPGSDSAEAQVFPAGTTVTLTTGEKTVTVTGEQFQEMTKPKRGRGRPKKAAGVA